MKKKYAFISIALLSMCSCNNKSVTYIEHTQEITVKGYYDLTDFTFAHSLNTYDIFENIDSLNESYSFLKESYQLGTTYEITISYPENTYTFDDIYILMSGTRLIPNKYIKNIKLIDVPKIKTIEKDHFEYTANGLFAGIKPGYYVTNIINNYVEDHFLIVPSESFTGETLYGFLAKGTKRYHCFTNYPDLSKITMYKAPAYNPELDRIIPHCELS